jgi:hypothetical protein
MSTRLAMLVAVPLLALVLAGCTTNFGGAPVVDSTPIDASLAKIAQPAFASDFANRTVRFEATFFSTFAAVVDLPSEYKEGYVRIMVDDQGTFVNNIVVPKDRADVLFTLKQGQRIRIAAFAQMTVLTALTGSQAQQLLLVANSVEVVGPAPKAPAAKRKTKPHHKPATQ